jgi:hypothetical protein
MEVGLAASKTSVYDLSDVSQETWHVVVPFPRFEGVFSEDVTKFAPDICLRFRALDNIGIYDGGSVSSNEFIESGVERNDIAVSEEPVFWGLVNDWLTCGLAGGDIVGELSKHAAAIFPKPRHFCGYGALAWALNIAVKA